MRDNCYGMAITHIFEIESHLNNGTENINIQAALFIIKSLTILNEHSINDLRNTLK